MPPLNFCKNRLCKNSWYQAEVGGFHQLKLAPLIFKMPSVVAGGIKPPIFKTRISKWSWHQAEVGGFPQLKHRHSYLNCLRSMLPLTFYQYRICEYLRYQAEVGDYPQLTLAPLIFERPSDFANRHVGGACFGRAFVQEEQLVAQSADFAMRLKQHRDFIDENSAVTYEGVYIDIWWPRGNAGRDAFKGGAVRDVFYGPVTIIAVDAPNMIKMDSYDDCSVRMLARKILLIFGVAQTLGSSKVFTGLLGGGAFRGNRPLILLLHLLLQPFEGSPDLKFHYPILASFFDRGIQELEAYTLEICDNMLQALQHKKVTMLSIRYLAQN